MAKLRTKVLCIDESFSLFFFFFFRLTVSVSSFPLLVIMVKSFDDGLYILSSIKVEV